MARTRFYALGSGLLLLASSGCFSDDEGVGAIGKVQDVMEKAAEAEYEPPEDGKLTEKQMQMWLEVKEKGNSYRTTAVKDIEKRGDESKGNDLAALKNAVGGYGSVAAAVTADVRAAQELGHNPKEFMWVESAVMEAFTNRMLLQAREQMKAAQKEMAAKLEKGGAKGAQAEAAKQMMAAMAAGPGGEELNEAQTANAELVDKHAERIETLMRNFAGKPAK